jgi:hypothetical protein
MRIASSLLVLPAIAASCSNPFAACADILRVRPIPADTAVSVGQQFTAGLDLGTCHDGRRKLQDTFSWTAADTTVVRVDPSTGVVRAVRSGQTRLVVLATKYGPLAGTLVTVR